MEDKINRGEEKMAKQWGFTYGFLYGQASAWASDITQEEEKIIKKATKEGTLLKHIEELKPLLERATEEICEWELAEYPEYYDEDDDEYLAPIDDIIVEFCDPNIDDYGALKDIGFDDLLWEDFSKYFREE